MRILFLTQVLPLPLDAGPKIRAYYVLRHLAEAGHEISLLSFLRRDDPPAAIQSLKKLCRVVETVPMVRSVPGDLWNGVCSLLSRRSFLIVRDERSDMRQKVQGLCQSRSFDAVHSDQLWMASYAVQACPLRRVLDQHNAVFQIPRRMAASERNPVKRLILKLEARKLARYEAETCSNFDRVVWVSSADLAALRADRPAGTVPLADGPVIPICVDPSATADLRPEARRFRVTFLGGMHWPPNAEGVRWFLRKVWPQVAGAAPDAALTLIGKKPPRLPADFPGKIELVGFVPDIRHYLEQTAVFIVPLLSGGGMRVKILDAWSWRLPVVSTSIGAEGLETKDGENILLADTAAAFSRSVVRALRDRSLSARLSEEGRSTVETRYDWKKIYSSWDEVYR
ncbi:MAG: glycosyltransferase family 4 protein [Acidobacteriota bacterium]